MISRGDGATTAPVLAASIVQKSLKLVTAGMNPMDLKRAHRHRRDRGRQGRRASCQEGADLREIAQSARSRRTATRRSAR